MSAGGNDLGGELLKSVSRSFYLTLRALPPKLRAPISLAYLLARASDTIADSAVLPAATRAEHLRAFFAMVEQGSDAAQVASLGKEITPENPAERMLISQLDRCFLWLDRMDENDRADIVDVLRKITRGQELDVIRFQNPAQITALQNAAELEEYTYLVAGCVGEFWTRICFRHVQNFSRVDEQTMQQRGIGFGKGLQLVNILRDLPADLQAGRCYLPADELAVAGCEPARPCLPVFERWLGRAFELLEDGFRYIEATRSVRLRYGCILPWYLGVRTLALLRQKPPLDGKNARVKVSRVEVRAALVLAIFPAISNAILRRVRSTILAGNNSVASR